MENKELKVSMLNGFSITLGDRTVGDSSGHSKSVWLLLAYLICAQGKAVPVDELIALLWEKGSKSANPRNAMKTIFFRARACLDQLEEGAGHQLILRLPEGYAWKQDLPLVLDTDQFRQLCAARGVDRLESQLQAVELFGQGFIPKLRDNAWAARQDKELRQLYIKTVKKILTAWERQSLWQKAADLCATASVQDPLNEELYLRRMAALIELGNSRAAAQVFEDMNQYFLSTTGGMPSEEVQALYRQAVSKVNDRRVAPAVLLEQLSEPKGNGAFFCDYDVFRALYRLQIRDSSRTEEETSLAIFTVTDQKDGELSPRSLRLVMDNLRQIAPPLLRQGDAMAKCSDSQYVLLLPRANFDNSRMVCERVRKAFFRQYPHSPAKLRVTVCPAKTANI